MKWIKFEVKAYDPHTIDEPPYDGVPFLACIWGNWVGQAIYARNYDASPGRIPMKYRFFYVTQNPENEGWKIRTEDEPFPITHWMPLPNLPKQPDLV